MPTTWEQKRFQLMLERVKRWRRWRIVTYTNVCHQWYTLIIKVNKTAPWQTKKTTTHLYIWLKYTKCRYSTKTTPQERIWFLAADSGVVKRLLRLPIKSTNDALPSGKSIGFGTSLMKACFDILQQDSFRLRHYIVHLPHKMDMATAVQRICHFHPPV